MKSRSNSVGSRRHQSESGSAVVDKTTESTDIIDTQRDAARKPTTGRSVRTNDRSVPRKLNPLSPDISIETKTNQMSKLRGNRGDRASKKMDGTYSDKSDLEIAKSLDRDNSRPTSHTKLKKEVPLRSSARKSEQQSPSLVTKLTAVEPNGNVLTVCLVLANRPYVVDDVNCTETDKTSPSANRRASIATTSGSGVLGNDGNQYYCQVCNGFGDVVCCDGCPQVFHPECVPLDGPSRKSLDNDDDPWYCPECIQISRKRVKTPATKKKVVASDINKSKTGTANKSNRKSDRPSRSSIERSTERNRLDQGDSSRKIKSLSTRGSLDAHEIDDTTCGNRVEKQTAKDIDDSDIDGHDGGDKSFAGNGVDNDLYDRKKKKRKNSMSSSPNHDDEILEDDISPGKKSKKKKKKKKSSAPGPSMVASEDADYPHALEEDVPIASKDPDLPQAIPAFYFYLQENRWKIERALARKHRYFNRLPKGVERNELVAKEAAMWWIKLRPTDHSRYMNMSMRDYEIQILEWKDEKNRLEGAYYDESNINEDELVNEDFSLDPQAEDDRLTYEKHDRLYLSTSVGSKPFKPEAGQNYNRVLLDLLHDTRFHPLPMVCVNRPETDTVIDEHSSKVTIPFFEVHGPVSTSIGDECLGCSRGWLHFCPVLQRRIPAVEHRAKLQPPLSSLMATRIGLGLRPPLDRPEDSDLNFDERIKDNGGLGVFCWRDSDEARDIKTLPVIPSCTVPDPSERVDDVVQFIEETTAMKVPEPPRPLLTEKGSSKKDGRVVSSIRKDNPSGQIDAENVSVNKCGRCRTIIDNDTGCVQCRRAQLVINKSKHQSSAFGTSPSRSKSESKTLKIHTAMLGRVPMKEGGCDSQSKSDQLLSEAILKHRWCPSAILPPQRVVAPSILRSSKHALDDDHDGDSDATSTEETSQIGEEHQDITISEEVQPLETPEGTEDLTADDRPSKRLRVSRAAASSITTAVPDRQEIMIQYKKEADELHKKAVQIVCYGILLALMRRDPLHLFALPVSVEGYNAMIQNPMDFGKIRENVLAGKYSSLASFASDSRLLCENALAYNPPSSIYFKTAKEMHDAIAVMQKRAANWMGAIKDAHTSFLFHKKASSKRINLDISNNEHDITSNDDDPFAELRQKWPQGVQMLESGDVLRKMIESDFMRTQENETAYYGGLAVCRAAAAAEASLAPYPDSYGMHSVVSKRKHYEDEILRGHIDVRVSQLVDPIQLGNVSTWREESVVRLMRKVQSRRLERRTISENGCSRCDGAVIDSETKIALNADSTHPGKTRKKGDFDIQRVDSSRVHLTTGLGSAKTCQKIMKRREAGPESAFDTVNEACVSVRGSRIHGMGLFADQPFKKGDVVAEYIGEYIVNAVADEREKVYRDQRIQDYQFRLNDKLVIDATMKGGHGRYINHNCTPSCLAKIIPYNPQKAAREIECDDFDKKKSNESTCSKRNFETSEVDDELLRRVIIIAQRNIEINEEITYDYQFPLELDLSARIPCNCQSEACRGFMNWDLPEKGSNNRALLVQKRGANMRDRIRRLGRPLKRDEM